MRKLLSCISVIGLAALSLTACGEKAPSYSNVGTEITIWATEKEEAVIKREVKKDVMLTLFIENKGFKEKVGVNTFGKLKRVLEVTNNKGEDPINEVLASTLVKFCKREHFDMFLRNQTIKNNSHI